MSTDIRTEEVIEDGFPAEMLSTSHSPEESEEKEDLDDDVEPEVAAKGSAKVKLTPPPQRREKPPAGNAVWRALDRKENENIREWIEGFSAGNGEVKITVHRLSPREHNGVKCDGLLASYSEPIDQEQIQEEHGGGDYQVRIQMKNAKGSWNFVKSTNCKVAGDPKVNGLRRGEPSREPSNAPSEDKSSQKIVDRALDYMMKEKPSTAPGFDMGLFQALLAPINSQLQASNRANQDLQERFLALQEKASLPKEEDKYKDKFLDKLMDGDSARLIALRTQHESEIRMLKENFREDEKRIHDRHERERVSAEKSHERELALVKSSLERSVEAKADQLSNIREIKEGRIRDLERELADCKSELATMRNKKDMSLKDKIDEMNGIKEMLGVGGDEDEKSGLEKVLNHPLLGVAADKIQGLLQSAKAPAAPALPPPGTQFQLPDGRVMVRDGAGNTRTVQRRRQRPPEKMVEVKQAAPTVNEAGETVQAAPVPETPPVSQAEMRMAMTYLENAMRNGTDPGTLAQSMRNILPPALSIFIRAHGVDAVLEQVAQLEPSSPLSNQEGRNYVRKVYRALSGMTDEE